MIQTPRRRHQTERIVMRRARAGHWLAKVRPEGWRNILATTPRQCSCFWCRSYRMEVAEYKARRTIEGAA